MSQDRIHSRTGTLGISPLPDSSGYPGEVVIGDNSGVTPGQGSGYGGAWYSGHYPKSGNPTTYVTGAQIVHSGMETVIFSAAGAITGLIIQAGTRPGQVLNILNATGSVGTFAAPATSLVRGGTPEIIHSLAAGQFIWQTLDKLPSTGTGGWYKVK